MKNAFFALAGAVASLTLLAGAAHAASVTNNDADPYTIQITENGERREISVGANQTVEACAAACFLTLPNGDLIALEGGETVTIVDGAATIN